MVEAAYRLFSAQGYNQTSAEEIAAAAAVSRATPFNHFPSKAALISTDGEQITAAPCPDEAATAPAAPGGWRCSSWHPRIRASPSTERPATP